MRTQKDASSSKKSAKTAQPTQGKDRLRDLEVPAAKAGKIKGGPGGARQP